MNIILDPGHGGMTNAGQYTTAPAKMFVFPDGDAIYEGVINRDIAERVYKCFMSDATFEHEVSFTVKPFTAKDLSLRKRVKYANAHKPNQALFISIHCNAGGGSGFEIYTGTGQTKADILATKIFYAVKDLYLDHGLNMRKDMTDGDVDKESQFYVLRKTKCPAVLLECGFFDHKKDAQLLRDDKFLDALAFRIYHGINAYLYNYETT